MSLHKISSHNTGHTRRSSHRFDGDKEKLDRFKREITLDADGIEEQRALANEDMRFVNVAGGMWEDFLENEFDDRVKLEMDLANPPLMRFLGEWAQNRVGVEFKPNDKGTTKDDSNLLNGIYRSDFRQNSGKIAVDNGVMEAATCGVGAVKLATVFEDDEDPENENQNIEFRPIFNAYNTVIWDVAAQRIDKKDARHCTVLAQFTHDSFKDEYPDADPASAYTPEIYAGTTLNRIKIIYVATRYEIVKKKEFVYVYNNMKNGKVVSYNEDDHELIRDELKADDLIIFVRKRKIMRTTVEKTVFSGNDILEPTRRITGKWIPIAPIYAIRAYVDGVEWYRGIVRKFKDGSRLYNALMSQVAENAASNGQDIPIFAPSQVEGDDMDEIWANRNNQPYMLAYPLFDKAGNIIHAGPLGTMKPGQLDTNTAVLLETVPKFIENAAGGQTQEALSKDMSGKAIRALVKRENLATQVISDNIATAIAHIGDIYQSIASEVYTSSRMVNTVSREGVDSAELLLENVVDQETGKPVIANDLTGRRFQSHSDAGPAYETMREQTVEEIKGMLETLGDAPEAQQYRPILFATMIANIPGVGLEPIKEFNHRKMLEQGFIQPKTPEDKAIVAAVQQQQQQPDPQAVLIESAAMQQQAEARSLDASSLQKTADAKKKAAETEEILQNIDVPRGKLLIDARKLAIEGLGQGASN